MVLSIARTFKDPDPMPKSPTALLQKASLVKTASHIGELITLPSLAVNRISTIQLKLF